MRKIHGNVICLCDRTLFNGSLCTTCEYNRYMAVAKSLSPTANQWAGTDPKPIEGWTITNSLPQPGFVWARPASGRSGHCGIVAHDGRIISGSEFNVNRRESEINKTLRKM